MRRTTVILSVLFFLCTFVTSGFAQAVQGKTVKSEAKIEVIKGKIVSIDTTKKEIVLKDIKTGAERTIVVSTKDIASLKIGDEVKVTLRAGTNAAESIKKIVKKTTPIKKSTK